MMRDYRDAKVMARALRSGLTDQGFKLTHSQSLELMAKAFGYDNWNILAAKIEAARPAAAAPDGPKTLHCSFCGKSQHDVKTLIAGPKVTICDECIGLCDEIIEHGAVLKLLAEDEKAGGEAASYPKVAAYLAQRSTDQLREYLEQMQRDAGRSGEGLAAFDTAIAARRAGKPTEQPYLDVSEVSDEELARRRRLLSEHVSGTERLIEIVRRSVEPTG